jgi:hypothetical protein
VILLPFDLRAIYKTSDFMAIVMDGETDSEYLKLTSFSELYTLKE